MSAIFARERVPILGGRSAYAASFGAQRGVHEMGLFFSVIAAAVLIVRLLSGRISDRHGIGVVLVPALVLMASGLLLLFLASAALYGSGYGVGALVTGLLVQPFGYSIAFAATAGFVVLGLVIYLVQSRSKRAGDGRFGPKA